MVRSLLVLVMSLICFWPARGIYAAEANLTTCQQFLADIKLTNSITKGQHNGTPCPCYEQRVSLDYSFHKNDNCYKQWFSVNNMKQKCCYDSNGKLHLGPQNGGYLIPDTLESILEDIHDDCCTATVMCKRFYEIFPSDNCSTSISYIKAKSWGDPEITTVDQHSYSFNGRGEYTFLETQNRSFQIQSRLDYVFEGNTDSTTFVAFVLYDKPNNDSVTIMNDNETLYIYQNDGTTWTRNCKQPYQLQGKSFQWFCTPNRVIIHPLQKISIEQIEIGGGKFMDIKIIGRNIKGMKGLAGNLVNGFFISNNGSRYKNTTEEELYHYGESFRIKSENESNFNYTITVGNFTYWNKNDKTPRFLDKLAKEGNYSELFRNFPKEETRKINSTCTNSWDNSLNIQCLLIIARTKNIKQGEYIMDISKEDHMKYLTLYNKPPEFKNSTPTFLNVSYGSTKVLDLKKFVTDDNDSPEKIQYEMITNLTEIKIENGVFNWTVGEELRYENFGLALILNDTFGFTTEKKMIIYYCGCMQISQCDFSSYNKNSSDKVKKALCKCPQYTSGLYCETEEDPCEDYNCSTTCNKSLNRTLPSWPCDDCPEGRGSKMVLKKQICENINECESLPKPCDQNCNDTNGSYLCSCKDGYHLNADKHTCDDINECELNHTLCPGEYKTCINTRGNYSCICRPGYLLKENTCTKTSGPQFVGNIVFTISQVDEENLDNKTIDNDQYSKDMQEKLTEMFKNVTNIVNNVEVIHQYFFRSQKTLHIEYVVTCKIATNYTVLAAALSPNKFKWIKTKIGDVTLNASPIEVKINNKSEGGICKVPLKTNCQRESTDCIDYDNGTYSCRCKKGFEQVQLIKSYCKDIDECALFERNITIQNRCVYGTCTNGVGSWNCTCPPNRIWQSVGNETYPVYRCQGKFTFIGNIAVADYDNAKRKIIVDFFQNQFRTFFTSPENEKASFTVPLNNLYVSANILTLTETVSLASFHQYNITYILTFGEAIKSERVSNVLKTVLGEKMIRVKNDSMDISFVNNSYYIFKDSDNKLCELTSHGRCDQATTNCRQRNGSTFCECKSGYYKKLGQSEKFCSDIDECNDGTERCNGEQCNNLPGNWTCECKGQYSVPSAEDRDNFACKNLTICEQNQNNFKCINGNRTCVDDHWECSCDNGSSPVWKDNGEVICEGEYKYIMSTGIVVPASVDITNDRRETYEKYMKEQITSVYSSKFPTQHVTVEIISVQIVVGNRQKREATKRLEVEFVLHFETKVSRKNITDAWTEYVNKNCSDGCKVSKDLPAIFIDREIYIEEDQSTALCSLPKYNHCDPVSTTCQLTDGRLNCSCNKAYTKKSDSTCEVSELICEGKYLCESGGKCKITISKSGYDLKCLCTDGRKGKYCEEIDPEYNAPSTEQGKDKKSKTPLIAVSSSLGSVIVILLVVFLLIFRWRTGKAKKEENISMTHIDTNGSVLTNQQDIYDEIGSVCCQRSVFDSSLPNSSLPYGHQHKVSGSGRNSGNQNEPLPNVFSKLNKLPRPNLQGSMPILANGGTNLNQNNYRRYSEEGPRRMTSNYLGLKQNSDFDRKIQWNNLKGRKISSPSDGKSKALKKDNGRPKSPKPDYHQARKHRRSEDSGVGTENSSESYEYLRPKKRSDHFYGQIKSINF